MQSFNENWDGIQRSKQQRLNEATPDEKAKQAAIDARVRKMNTDDAVEQVKEILRSYGNDKKQREMIIAAIKNIKEETAAAAQRLNEAFHSFTPMGGKQGSQMGMKHFTDMDELSKKISAHAKGMKSFNPNLGGTNAEARGTLLNIAETLLNAHRQQQDFMKGLIYHIEGVHKKVMSPSRHGNMEILNDLSDIIRELKKYQK